MSDANSFLSNEYWNNRYLNQNTGWDIGYASFPIKEYIDQLIDKSIGILIPGAGNAHEAQYLHDEGFTNVHVLDFATIPLNRVKEECPNWSSVHFISGNFFEHTGQYDIIFEQTFFCALNPDLRTQYVDKMHALLKPTGKLVGLLFNDALLNDNPPFGGTKEEYLTLFSEKFIINKMEKAYNSIPPRSNREVFISLSPK